MKSSSIAANVLIVAAAVACFPSRTSRFVSAFAPRNQRISKTTRLYSELPREMSQMGFHHDDSSSVHKKKRDQSSLLSAVAIDSSWNNRETEQASLWNQIQPILSTALLITGNTVGASCLVLPEMAARPGMAVSTLLFLGT